MAYTKYSLTPANNTAAPPDGAPEGMLPSAVNDTMRDMMAQIRDVGDGIRDGTYTMTTPKITGGTITGAAFTGNTFTSPVISGGTINNATIGATTASTGAFSTLSATGATTFSGATVVSGSLTANTFSSSGATITGGTISGSSIAATQLTGTINAARLPAGNVIQVVSVNYSTSTSTTSGSFVDLGLSASITPTSSSSKILAIACLSAVYKNGANSSVGVNIVRGSTEIVKFSENTLAYTNTTGASGVAATMNYLDSPSTCLES